MSKIGFLGMGNMAQALAVGLIRAGKTDAGDIYAFAPNQTKLGKNAERLGFIPCKSAADAVKEADIVILACKPYQVENVLKDNDVALRGKLIVSVAYGTAYADILPILPEGARYQYMVPNTPVSVCSGIFLAEEASNITEKENDMLEELFGSIGTYMKLPADRIAAANGIAGCGPAFMAMVMEALGDAGVKNGLTRSQAYQLSASVMEGTAKLQADTGLHPGVLKDQVCSPGGVTIKGVAALEEAGMRNAFIKAIDATL